MRVSDRSRAGTRVSLLPTIGHRPRRSVRQARMPLGLDLSTATSQAFRNGLAANLSCRVKVTANTRLRNECVGVDGTRAARQQGINGRGLTANTTRVEDCVGSKHVQYLRISLITPLPTQFGHVWSTGSSSAVFTAPLSVIVVSLKRGTPARVLLFSGLCAAPRARVAAANALRGSTLETSAL